MVLSPASPAGMEIRMEPKLGKWVLTGGNQHVREERMVQLLTLLELEKWNGEAAL